MRRGLKPRRCLVDGGGRVKASNRSPMRRGLKRNSQMFAMLLLPSFKPIPDEEGTETEIVAASQRYEIAGFKPIPDEEGTETLLSERDHAGRNRASNRSPMRRGLKRGFRRAIAATDSRASNRSPMRRGLKPRPMAERLRLRCASNRSPMRRGLKPDCGGVGAMILTAASNRSPMRRGLKRWLASRHREPHAWLQTDPR